MGILMGYTWMTAWVASPGWSLALSLAVRFMCLTVARAPFHHVTL
jgi:hypothetical protein